MMNREAVPENVRPIFVRRSCRAFHSGPVPERDIEILIESMRWAPSAGNRQPWHFYLVRNPQMKASLAEAAYGQDFVSQAPVVFVVCAIPERSETRYGQRGRELYVFQDTAAAVQNLLLSATALGYGSCWVGAFNESAAGAALNLPSHQRPVAMVPIGKPAEHPRIPKRLDIQRILTVMD